MFGFFKQEKKKKSAVPEFDPKLIKKFNKDHGKLVGQVSTIRKAVETGNIVKAKQGLKKLKMEILGHFMEEDIKLYWYLNMFEETIKKIQKDIVHFLDYYAKEDVKFDMVFEKEFNMIVEALTNRMETEESNLYTLYIK